MHTLTSWGKHSCQSFGSITVDSHLAEEVERTINNVLCCDLEMSRYFYYCWWLITEMDKYIKGLQTSGGRNHYSVLDLTRVVFLPQIM